MVKLAIHGGKPVSGTKIPLVKPTFTEKTKKDIGRVLDSGYLRMGPYTEEFEEKFKDQVGSKYAYAVCNGTAALHLAYMSVIKPGEEVIVPSFTFFATASMVLLSQGKPVFADIDPDTFLIDVEDVKEKITPKTRGVAPVHLFGNACDMDALTDLAQDHHLLMVSDSAQAHGTKYRGKDLGSFDDLNCYSFYPTKTLTTGEGGIVTTNDKELYRIGTLLRSHGEDARYHHIALGLNYRMTDIAAVIGLNQIERIDEFLRLRRKIGGKLRKGLKHIEILTTQIMKKPVSPSYSYFSIKLDLESLKCNRDEFMEALRAENIDCSVHYPIPLTKQPIIQKLLTPEPCPIAEDTSKKILSLPMHPHLTDVDISKIVEGVQKVSNHYHK
jgi:perosamine synthetase